MAGMCCEINVTEGEPTAAVVSSIGAARMDLRQLRIMSDMSEPVRVKRRRIQQTVVENLENALSVVLSPPAVVARDVAAALVKEVPRFGVTSVCGRRRDMEDAVSIRPSFCEKDEFHFYGVFDGHGCSHVAKKCKEVMHKIVKEEIESRQFEKWPESMAVSFTRMDEEVGDRNNLDVGTTSCRCELQSPQCDTVGSTAVIAVVTPEKIVVANCGDSRAVLCRNGVAIPLSSDHKPDRPDELARIEEAGGRVIFWDGPRVLGVLAMSRAVGDNYLKPCVIPDPEVTVTDRGSDDECLILASDGLWDVVSNETAVSVARICLKNAKMNKDSTSEKACSDASLLLTKLALARRSADNISVVVVDLRRQ